MILGVNPTVDYAFKHLLGRDSTRPILMNVLDSVLQPAPGHGIREIELLNPFNPKEALEDKLSVLDIKARDQSGRQFNVEMQMLALGSFRSRVLYYWARLHQSQLQEGEDYSTLRPTVSICFVNAELFPQIPGWHACFELRERRTQVVFSDQQVLHLLELPKFTLSANEVRTPLERWIYFLRHGEGLDPEHLPVELQTQELHHALKEL